jgi:hypothetical protein
MTMRWILVLCVAVVVGGVVAGISQANAQDGTSSSYYEYGVFRSVWRLEDVREALQVSYGWITSAEEEREDDVGGLWTRLGIEGAPRNDASDRIRVLDHLSTQGWEVVTRSDMSAVGSGATAVSVNYLLRRLRRPK